MTKHGDMELTRRGLLGASAAMADAWAAGGGPGAGSRAYAATGMSVDDRVQSLRSQFFSGPITDRIDLDSLDPARRSDATQIGTIGHWDRQFVEKYPWITTDNMLPFVVAAGIKWVRTGLVYQDWDWSANRPTESLRDWVAADLASGVKPLFTVNNNVHVGAPEEISGAVDLVRGAVSEWGEDVGAFMFGNEPGNGIWKRHYGGDYSGGPWVERYAQFVDQGSRAIKAEHPNVFLVNGVQVEQVAMTQLKQSSPLIGS